MESIPSPLPFGVDFRKGIDDVFPGFHFSQDADLRVSSQVLFQSDSVPTEFSLTFIVQPETDAAAMLFAILNPEQTVISFGVGLSAVENGKTNISLYFNNYKHALADATQPTATFTVPAFTNDFKQFAISLKDEELTLYFDCDLKERLTSVFTHDSGDLPLVEASSLYIAKAGDLGYNFQVKHHVYPSKYSYKIYFYT